MFRNLLNPRLDRWLIGFSEIASLVVFVIGSSGFLGHVFDRPSLYSWDGSGMTTGGSFCVSLLALAQFASLNMTPIPKTSGRIAAMDLASSAGLLPQGDYLHPVDLIALVALVGCFVMMGIGKDTEINHCVLMAIVGFYFAKFSKRSPND